MPRNAEDWREKGAAVGRTQGTDPTGQPTQRMIKKGVKDFNFGRTLGEGSYSTVLAATDRQNLKEYAIKVLDKRHIIKEKKVKYVNIERDTLNRLTDHPGVVRLYYTFQDERSLYFVLDLASGGELLGVLKKLGSFDVECSRFYAAEILDSIAYMHSKGVIHRDLKPENVLLDRDMHVKITDFGTAKILKTEPKSSGPTSALNGDMPGDPTDGAESDRAVSFVGTAEYVSPELLRDKNACKSSDLWAFGCILFQLIAGRPPFKAANEYLTFQKILGLEYTFPDGFPEVARDLVERLLVLEPANRLPVEHIRNHRFFEGVTWGKSLWRQKAPRLKAYVPPAAAPIKLGGSGNGVPFGQISSGPSPVATSQAPLQTQPLPTRPQLRGITELPPPSQLDIDWSPVLTHNNERILKLGNLIVNTSSQASSPGGKNGDPTTPSEKPKFSRFFSGSTTKKKERLVLITSNARVILAPAGGHEKKIKMEIPLVSPGCSWKSYVDSRGLTAWSIDTVCLIEGRLRSIHVHLTNTF
jgi:3-phosphoinositide dependent protein kinase-1